MASAPVEHAVIKVPYLVLALVVVGLAAYLSERERSASSAIAADSSPSSPTVIVVRTTAPSSSSSPLPVAPVALGRSPSSIPTPPVASRASSPMGNPFVQAATDTFAPLAPGVASATLDKASSIAISPFGGTPVNPTGVPALGGAVGSALGAVGDAVNVPIAAIFVGKSLGVRGQSEKQQQATFGKAAVSTAQTAIGAGIPILGPAFSALLGAGASTHEGQRAVKATGVAIEQGYTAQKKLVKGDIAGAFSGGGKDQHDRKASFFVAVDDRVTELQQGGKLDQKDIDGFNQAKAYGYTFSGGVDLSKVTLQAGTNPFLKG